MEVGVFIGVHGVDFDPDDLEILPRELAGLADVFDPGVVAAFAGEDEDLLEAGFGDLGVFALDFAEGEAGAVDFVVAVEAAVDAVVFAVVGDVDRGEEGDGVAEVAARLCLSSPGDGFEVRLGGGGEQGLEVLVRKGGFGERCLNLA